MSASVPRRYPYHDHGHRPVIRAVTWSPARMLASNGSSRPMAPSPLSPDASVWDWLVGATALTLLAVTIGFVSSRDGNGASEAPTINCRSTWHIGHVSGDAPGRDPADVLRVFKKCCAGDENRCE